VNGPLFRVPVARYAVMTATLEFERPNKCVTDHLPNPLESVKLLDRPAHGLATIVAVPPG
jgi:hypothetical protein